MDVHPSAEELDRWLQNELQECEDKAIAEHISQCKDVCQAYLDRLVPFTRDADIIPPVSFCRATCPGDSVAGYEILEEIGHGGMGIVYRAWSRPLGRVVALKMLINAARREPRLLIRFRQEIEAAGRLSHPNIIAILDSGVQDGVPFLVMEFAEQETLAAKLIKQPLAPREAAKLSVLLAEACEHAHAHGIVHRDLKPPNILFSSCKRPESESASYTGPAWSIVLDGHTVIPKIGDFGLAKIADGETDLASCDITSLGDRPGTPSYMAPEQADGGTRPVGPTADVYALGAVLYEMLTGRPPFKAASALETMRQVVHDEAVAPSQLQPKTPIDLDTICLRCLDKTPNRRYATAKDLAEDLERFLAGKRTLARPLGPISRMSRWCRRHPNVIGAIAITAIAFTGVSWEWQKAEASRREAEKNFYVATKLVNELLDTVRSQEARRSLARNANLLTILESWRGLGRQRLARDSSDPWVQETLAQVALVIAQVQYENGDYDEVAQSCLEAIPLFDRLFITNPNDPRFLRSLVESQGVVAAARHSQNRFSEAISHYEIAEKQIKLLMQRDPDPRWPTKLAQCRWQHAGCLDLTGRPEESLKLHRVNRAELELFVAKMPGEINAQNVLLAVLVQTKELDAACEQARRVAALRNNDQRSCADLGICLWRLARENGARATYQEAIAALKTALAALNREMDDNLADVHSQFQLPELYGFLMQCHGALGDPVAAEADGLKAYKCLKELIVANPKHSLSGYHVQFLQEFPRLYVKMGKREEAIASICQIEELLLQGMTDQHAREHTEARLEIALGLLITMRQCGGLAQATQFADRIRHQIEKRLVSSTSEWREAGLLAEAWTVIAKNSMQTADQKTTLAALRQAANWQRRAFENAPSGDRNRVRLDDRLARLGRFLSERSNWSESTEILLEREEIWNDDAKALGNIAKELRGIYNCLPPNGAILSDEERKLLERLPKEISRIEAKASKYSKSAAGAPGAPGR